jgi:hypothetical protein
MKTQLNRTWVWGMASSERLPRGLFGDEPEGEAAGGMHDHDDHRSLDHQGGEADVQGIMRAGEAPCMTWPRDVQLIADAQPS